MKTLRKIHLCLGCVFAPLLIFFAVSGAWQTFMLHHALKDGSYSPPAWISALSEVHQHQRWPGKGVDAPSSILLRCVIALMSCGLMVTTVLGVIMAFKAAKPRMADLDLSNQRFRCAGLSAFAGTRLSLS